MIDGLLLKKGKVTRAHKEMIKDKYKDVIMNAYQTRIRDGVEVPRDTTDFQRSITRIMQGRVNNEARNFF